MPIVQLPNKNAKRIIDDYLKHRVPIAFEFIILRDPVGVIDNFDEIRKKGANIWVNALREKQNAGHDDEKAAQDPTVYDWYIETILI